MMWQGHVRKLAKTKPVVVGCRSAMKPLYWDFTDRFICYPHTYECCNARCADRDTKKWIVDFNAKCHADRDGKMEAPRARNPRYNFYIRYGEYVEAGAYDLVVHARMVKKTIYGECALERNWSEENWNRLAMDVTQEFKGLRVASIGTQEEAIHVPGTVDLRGMALHQVMDVLASSRVLMGPPSGPIHLGALCGIPYVCWQQHSKPQNGYHRLTKTWNPFNVPVDILVGTWQPDPRAVWDATKQMLDRSPSRETTSSKPADSST